jgi:hypothetical protein
MDSVSVEAVVGASVPKSRFPHPGGNMATQSPPPLLLYVRRILVYAFLQMGLSLVMHKDL